MHTNALALHHTSTVCPTIPCPDDPRFFELDNGEDTSSMMVIVISLVIALLVIFVILLICCVCKNKKFCKNSNCCSLRGLCIKLGLKKRKPSISVINIKQHSRVFPFRRGYQTFQNENCETPDHKRNQYAPSTEESTSVIHTSNVSTREMDNQDPELKLDLNYSNKICTNEVDNIPTSEVNIEKQKENDTELEKPTLLSLMKNKKYSTIIRSLSNATSDKSSTIITPEACNKPYPVRVPVDVEKYKLNRKPSSGVRQNGGSSVDGQETVTKDKRCDGIDSVGDKDYQSQLLRNNNKNMNSQPGQKCSEVAREDSQTAELSKQRLPSPPCYRDEKMPQKCSDAELPATRQISGDPKLYLDYNDRAHGSHVSTVPKERPNRKPQRRSTKRQLPNVPEGSKVALYSQTESIPQRNDNVVLMAERQRDDDKMSNIKTLDVTKGKKTMNNGTDTSIARSSFKVVGRDNIDRVPGEIKPVKQKGVGTVRTQNESTRRQMFTNQANLNRKSSEGNEMATMLFSDVSSFLEDEIEGSLV